jgi:hypothetical protein
MILARGECGFDTRRVHGPYHTTCMQIVYILQILYTSHRCSVRVVQKSHTYTFCMVLISKRTISIHGSFVMLH